jgi:hypothetical protein
MKKFFEEHFFQTLLIISFFIACFFIGRDIYKEIKKKEDAKFKIEEMKFRASLLKNLNP